jgi:hypothetical protein
MALGRGSVKTLLYIEGLRILPCYVLHLKPPSVTKLYLKTVPRRAQEKKHRENSSIASGNALICGLKYELREEVEI